MTVTLVLSVTALMMSACATSQTATDRTGIGAAANGTDVEDTTSDESPVLATKEPVSAMAITASETGKVRTIITTDGEELGRHQGLMYYTLGQRKGLGIGGMANADETPWFVVEKDLEKNRLVVAQGHSHPLLMKGALHASQLHWVSGSAPVVPLECKARIRHRQPLQACSIESINSDECRVSFQQPQRAVTPGQSIVFYLGDECLGGGIIDKTFN